jgi:hypothetical protein
MPLRARSADDKGNQQDHFLIVVRLGRPRDPAFEKLQIALMSDKMDDGMSFTGIDLRGQAEIAGQCVLDKVAMVGPKPAGA